MSSIDRQQLPAGLNEEPGPALCAALDNVEPWRLTADDTVMILHAWQSQVAYTQARFMEAMLALGSCRPAPPDTVAHYPEPPEHASDEVRVALTWTRRAAENQFYLALDLQHRIPAAHQALLQGQLDLPRAKVLADWTRDLTPEQAQRLCGLLLPEAMQLTTGQLTERAKQLAIAMDPDFAARRYRQAVTTRRITGYRNPDGTANLSGLDLPLDQAAAACAHLEDLACRIKQAGHCGPIDHIRADLFLAMLDGTLTGWTEPQIIEHFLTPGGSDHDDAGPDREHPSQGHTGQRFTGRTARTQPGHEGRGAPTPGGDSGSSASQGMHPRGADSKEKSQTKEAVTPERIVSPGEAGPYAEESIRTETAEPGHGRERQFRGARRADETRRGRDKRAEKSDAQSRPPQRRRRSPGGGEPDGFPTDAPPANPRTGIHVRLRLSTLLGLDRLPAELPGWGHTHAEHARHLVRRFTGARWRYTVCDEQGTLLHTGPVTARPADHPPRTPVVGGAVEIQVPLTLLERLHAEPDQHPPWARVIDQIVRDLTARRPTGAGRDHDTGAQTTGDATNGTSVGQRSERRFPTPAMRHRVQARDRNCVFPGCRMPARDTDTDHVRQWQDHGLTQDSNLVSLCRHDHRLKDTHGWKLTAHADGTNTWTSPLGLSYTTRRPPVLTPLPRTPAHRPAPRATQDAIAGSATAVWDRAAGHDPVWTGDTGTGRLRHPAGGQNSPPATDRASPLISDEQPPF